MDYKKQDNFVVISKLTQNEIFAFLKAQIECTLRFDNGDYHDFLGLHLRQLKSNSQVIEISDISNPENYIISYSKLIDLLTEKLALGILTVEIDQKIFKQKEPLITILDTIKLPIIESCVYIDYIDGVFALINKPLTGGISDKLYYFETNDSLLIFGQNGPRLIYESKFTSIEDVLC